MPVGRYQELKVWQTSMELVRAVYRLSTRFPTHERFCLTSQIRRCGISIPSNIAEGHARRSRKEYFRYVVIALGSLAELETQMLIARDLRYVSNEDTRECRQLMEAIGRMLRGLESTLAA